jgi:hypothetical protein
MNIEEGLQARAWSIPTWHISHVPAELKINRATVIVWFPLCIIQYLITKETLIIRCLK